MAGDMAQASQIWSMLDDMADSNPAAYRKFIDKHIKEGQEMMEPPKPHMCVQTCIVGIQPLAITNQPIAIVKSSSKIMFYLTYTDMVVGMVTHSQRLNYKI